LGSHQPFLYRTVYPLTPLRACLTRRKPVNALAARGHVP